MIPGARPALVAVALLLLAAGTVRGQALPACHSLRLELPVDCEIGVHCFVQNHVDAAPGAEARDFTCGSLAYDGDRGTDLRVATTREMMQGVTVLAAAPGVVKALRDGEPDAFLEDKGRDAIRGREAGNAVVLDHGDGWETQYSHMRRGSVRVQVGQQVAAGDPLGLIGLSGNTDFPHLELAVRHQGRAIDPFTGLPSESGCGQPGRSLWSASAAEALAYRPGGALAAGFTDRFPSRREILRGGHRSDDLDRQVAGGPDALVFWVLSFGLHGGDRETLRLTGPDGGVVVEAEEVIPRDKAQWFRFAGRPRPTGGWPAGRYRGTYRVERNGRAVVELRREVDLP